MSRNLLLAVHAEHRQRTGHDVFTFDVLQCDVCAYLNAAKESLAVQAAKLMMQDYLLI